MAPKKLAFTKTAIDALQKGAKAYCVWDERQPGFCVKVTPAGSKSFYAVSRVSGRGSPVWVYLGKASGAFDVAGLRRVAASRIGAMNDGKDPNQVRRAKRTERRLSEFFEDYDAQVLSKRKPRTVEENRRMWRLHIEPAFGRSYLSEITRANVAKWHATMAKDHPPGANRRLALLRHILNVAEDNGELPRDANPARGVTMARETPKERFLSAQEREVLDKVLAATKDPYVVAATVSCRSPARASTRF